jgi:hypothetical protein
MKKLFLLGFIASPLLFPVISSAQPSFNKAQPIIEIKEPIQSKSDTSNIYERPPSMWLIQSKNILMFDSGVDGQKIQKIPVRSGAIGLQQKPGEYIIEYYTHDPVNFIGWGHDSTLFADNAFSFVRKGDSLKNRIAKGLPVGMGHTQPRHCSGLQSYLKAKNDWVKTTNEFLKQNKTLVQSDPAKFKLAYFQFSASHPKPPNPCSQGPEVATGESHGCLRIGRSDAMFAIQWLEFHDRNKQPVTMWIDQRPPSFPASYQP